MASQRRIKLKGGVSTENIRLDRIPQFDKRSRDYELPPRKDRRTPRSYTCLPGFGREAGHGERPGSNPHHPSLPAKKVLLRHSKWGDPLLPRQSQQKRSVVQGLLWDRIQ